MKVYLAYYTYDWGDESTVEIYKNADVAIKSVEDAISKECDSIKTNDGYLHYVFYATVGKTTGIYGYVEEKEIKN